MPANEVEALLRKELSQLSQSGVIAALKMKKWSAVQVRRAAAAAALGLCHLM